MDTLKKQLKLIGYTVLAVVLLVCYLTDAFYPFESAMRDVLYKDTTERHPNVFVIGIDDKALSEIGSFTKWTRRTMADAINRLNADPQNKPAVIGVDVVYANESNDKAADAALVEAVKNGGNVVMSAMVIFGEELVGDDETGYFNKKAIVAYDKPFEELLAAGDIGFINSVIEKDGFVRYGNKSLNYDNETLYSFSHEIARKFLGVKEIEIPLNDSGLFYINYSRDVGGYYNVDNGELSFADIFRDDFDPSMFAGSIVFIGPFSEVLKDSYSTSVNRVTQMNGVEIHANIVQMILDGKYKMPLPRTSETVIMVALLLLFTVFFIRARTDMRVALAGFLLFAVGYTVLNRVMFNLGWIMLLTYPIISAGVLLTFQAAYNFILDRIEKQRIKDSFKKYVDPRLVDKLIATGEANSDAVGAKKHIAVMFAEVRGFHPLAKELKDEPEAIVEMLNSYFELTSAAVFDNGGSIDKFIGDATMALFNGFVPTDDYVYRAAKAAWEIVTKAASVNASLLEKYGTELGFGVGICCGGCIVGNLGPSFRKDYTAIGDTVNTAARLKSNAGVSQILVSKEVIDACGGRVTAVSLGEIQMKGKGPMEIFSVTNVI